MDELRKAAAAALTPAEEPEPDAADAADAADKPEVQSAGARPGRERDEFGLPSGLPLVGQTATDAEGLPY